MTGEKKGILGFWPLLFESGARANRQVKALLKTLFWISLYFLRDAAIPVVMLAAAFWISKRDILSSDIISLASILWLVVLGIKYDGAVGYMFASLPLETPSREIARTAVRRGFKFFINAINTGVLLVFGQMLLICPCFIAMDNFIFSPFLIIYEGRSGADAKERSRELASGFGYLVLYRTVSFLLIAYAFLALAIAIIFIRAEWLALLVLALAGMYISLMQSNFIRQIYLEMLGLQSSGAARPAQAGMRGTFLAIGFMIILAFLIYAIFKFLPFLVFEINRLI